VGAIQLDQEKRRQGNVVFPTKRECKQTDEKLNRSAATEKRAQNHPQAKNKGT